MTELITDINVIEILLLSVLSFIGAFCNRFWQFLSRGTPITLRTWIAIFINVIIVTIICISIDSFLIDINPRLMLLPPFLMSLVGDELFLKLMHINSSIQFIDWILRVLKVKSGEPVNVNEISKDKISDHEYKNFVKSCVTVTTKIEESLLQFKKTKDMKVIFNCYKEVIPEVSALEIQYKIDFKSDPLLATYVEKMIALQKNLENFKDGLFYSDI